MNRINLYIFSQIIKSCILVFFIFVSIAWLLQLSRLFNVMSHLQINSIEIMYLSLLMIPNVINVILPFLMIFGFVLSFIKLSKDKEIIAMYSIGLSINEINAKKYKMRIRSSQVHAVPTTPIVRRMLPNKRFAFINYHRILLFGTVFDCLCLWAGAHYTVN